MLLPLACTLGLTPKRAIQWLTPLALALTGCAGEELVAPLDRGAPPPIVDRHGRVPDLACPGDPGCESNEGPLLVGAAARAITPHIEAFSDENANGKYDLGEPFSDTDGDGVHDTTFLAGFSTGRAARSVHDPVWSRVIVLRQGDVSIGLVALDLVGLFHDDVVRIRQAAKDAGLDFDHIAVSSTHTHEGPDTMGIWGENPLTSGYDESYVRDIVIGQTVAALRAASEAEQPVDVRHVQTEAPHLVNDTREPYVQDQALSLIQFTASEDRSVIATAMVWGNHPEALGSDNTALTSDFPHYAREELELIYPGSLAVYFSGSLGGLSTTIGVTGCPDQEGADTCPQGEFKRAEFIGRGAAGTAAQALEGPSAVAEAEPKLGVRRRGYLLTTENGALALAFWLGLLPRNLYSVSTGRRLDAEEVAALGPSDITSQAAAIESELNLITLGSLAIATVPGELYPELWLVGPNGESYVAAPAGADFQNAPAEPPLQSLLPAGARPIILNNGNDALGYILPRSQWDEKPPFAYGKTESPQYGEQNSLGPAIAARIAEEFATMVAD